ncbi:MAG: hypothetical protein GXP49_01815 [Deltaproteobacteria bacterium]|nr:hypothetical protein [Deltaproteobacteria bacterium]
MTWRRIVGMYILVFVIMYTPGTMAKNPLIQKAKEAYEILDLDGARDILAEALANPDNTDEDLKEIYELMGITYALLDKEDKAQEAFRNMLAIDRDADLDPSVPEQVQSIFDKVKRNLPDHLEKPKPAVAQKSKEPPALEEAQPGGEKSEAGETSAEDDLSSILGEGDNTVSGKQKENEGETGGRSTGEQMGDKSEMKSTKSNSEGDLDLAALEAEAAAAVGEGDESSESGEGTGAGTGGTEIIEAQPESGTSGDVVKIFPPAIREVTQGQPIEIEVEVDDLSGVTRRLVLYYRQSGTSTGFSSVDGQQLSTGKYFIKIPMIWNLSAGDELALDYYIEALGAGDQVVGSYGNAEVPHLFRKVLQRQEVGRTVVQRGAKPFYEKAWFWGLVGGVVAAGTAAGLTVAFWPEAKKASPGALGKLQLQPK